ncbi:DEAD/DEAH box helicase [Megasphaera sp. UBA4382]|uniref:DEAD/DEAH box helicase n=1 Tax=Megasphaera sp. UBA4382 TaxID=1946850 RepID=UPI0025C5A99B|nr:DEAD/DEAH box helicase [Megasphaera sp. UBA4382]
MKLRPYQEELVRKIKLSMVCGHRHIVAVLGCGGGKSVIQAAIAKSATDKGNRVLFLVHRRELCDQIERTFSSMGVNMALCQIGMVQTVTRRIAKIPEPAVILQDEAHHALSRTYRRIYDAFCGAYLLGFTATPQRMNEGGLGDVFDDLIESVSTEWLIQNHYLSPYEYYGVTLADTKGLHTRRGDYVKEELAELMEQHVIYGDTVKNWKRYADGKQTIVYCASIAASKETAAAFRSIGIQAVHLDGATPKREREQAVQAFRDGTIQVVCNVDLFGEGFDVPDCEAVVLLRPTKSLTLHIQQSMRSMRFKPGKTAIILDHVGNYLRHGLPDDKREWTLKTKKRKTKNEIRVRTCPNCYAVLRATATRCSQCGAELKQTQTEQDQKVKDMLLQKISHQPYDSYHKCQTWDQLELFRKAKKYKFAWSLHKAVELQIPIPSKYMYMLYRMGMRA